MLYFQKTSTISTTFAVAKIKQDINVSDVKRGLLEKASDPPGSESPLKFDAYTLNHAAFVGMNEVGKLDNKKGLLKC